MFNKRVRRQKSKSLGKNHFAMGTRKEKSREEPDNFHRAMLLALVVGQAFALMPVDGVARGPSERLNFTWKSLRMVYSACLTLALMIPTCVSLYDMVTHEASIGRFTTVVFFFNGVCVHVLFVSLARRWPDLMKMWRVAEQAGGPLKLNRRLRTITASVLALAVVEHLLSVANNLLNATRHKRPDQDIYEYFYATISFPQIFELVNYNAWLGVFFQIITVISTFSWTYIDLFVMLVSAALALRFRQVAERVEALATRGVVDVASWRTLRVDYDRLALLCHELNSCVSTLVTLSFSSNLYFILVQLYHSLKNIEDEVSKIYFYFSFAFLIGRAVCVCLYGAWIHDESRRPLLTLNTLPPGVYNVEIKRLTLHVCFDPAALTGRNFFRVTRGLILSICGTIMTYELVLIQYFTAYQTAVNGNTTGQG